MDSPILLPIKKIIKETDNVKTYLFDHQLQSKPGQFVMLWIPGFDQKPFSVGFDNGKQFGLTIFALGQATHTLANMKVGDRVGISGPYGTNFSIKPKTHYIMIGGGYGAAPLGFLAEEIVKKKSTADFCIGARSKEHLLFEKRIKKLSGVKLHIATNDGSVGYKGFVTDLLPDLIKNAKLKKKKRDPSPRRGAQDDNSRALVVTCGPELMEKKVLDKCNELDINCEISIERYMKCGFGVCGQCCVDPLGIRMCKEGPVVKRELANKITEFGKYHRDKSGTKVNF